MNASLSNCTFDGSVQLFDFFVSEYVKPSDIFKKYSIDVGTEHKIIYNYLNNRVKRGNTADLQRLRISKAVSVSKVMVTVDIIKECTYGRNTTVDVQL